MILHTALFTWKPEVTDATVTELTAALEEMAASLAMLHGYRCGPNARVRPSPADYVVVALVDDEDALGAYLDSPEHAAVYERFLGAMIASRQAAQIVVPAGAAL